MNSKFTEKKLVPGILPGDFRGEIFGESKTRKVFFIQNGKSTPLNRDIKALILEQLLEDKKAMTDLSHLTLSEAIEEYAFCCYGTLDGNPDILPNGELGKVESFRCSNNCKCAKWPSKRITHNGVVISNREQQVLRQLASEHSDQEVANILNISKATLDSHKSSLFEKLNVRNRTGLISKALNLKILDL